MSHANRETAVGISTFFRLDAHLSWSALPVPQGEERAFFVLGRRDKLIP